MPMVMTPAMGGDHVTRPDRKAEERSRIYPMQAIRDGDRGDVDPEKCFMSNFSHALAEVHSGEVVAKEECAIMDGLHRVRDGE